VSKRFVFVVLIGMIAIIGSRLLSSPSVPARFPQFSEEYVAGPGVYHIPQWSSDSRYLAFIDGYGDESLKLYNTETKTTWTVANNIDGRHFSWGPNSTLTYLRYRPDLSGSPFPAITDLHQVDLDGKNDKILIPSLSNISDFVWFKDGKRLAFLQRNPGNDNVYILDVMTNTTAPVVKAGDLDLQHLSMFAFTPDEKTLLLYGYSQESGETQALIVIYELETRTILKKFQPSDIIPSTNKNYPGPGLGDSTNYGWVGGNRWFLTAVNAPSGSCYNYALFFFDMHDLPSSFCIPAVGGIVGDPAISPDLTRISYVTMAGPRDGYVVVGKLTSDLIDKLALGINNLGN
jgi:Tol biopolymer transport system component